MLDNDAGQEMLLAREGGGEREEDDGYGDVHLVPLRPRLIGCCTELCSYIELGRGCLSNNLQVICRGSHERKIWREEDDILLLLMWRVRLYSWEGGHGIGTHGNDNYVENLLHLLTVQSSVG